jgi:arylsulfatase A-like enzyme
LAEAAATRPEQQGTLREASRIWVVGALIVAIGVVLLGIATSSGAQSVTCNRVADTGGSDLNAGTVASPWRTAQKLVDNLNPGETGCLNEGTFTEDVTATNSGTSGARITVRSTPGDVGRIKGRLHVTASNITFSQLALDGSGVASSSAGVGIEGDDVQIADDNITTKGAANCVGIGEPSDRAFRAMLLRNRIHNCRAGVRIKVATNATLRNNLIFDSIDRGVRMDPDAFSSYVVKNVIDGNGEGVLFAGDASTASTSNAVHYNVISNSNVLWNLGSAWAPGLVGSFNHTWNNCVHATNLDPNYDARGGVAPESPTRGFASYFGVISDPGYVDRDAKDFHLNNGPCRELVGDIAANLDGPDRAPSDDQNVNPRPNILVIMTDDQRLEGTMVAMPKTLKWFQNGGDVNGDLVAGGTGFMDATDTTPLCCPGRASGFSGLYAHNHLVQHIGQLQAFDQAHTLQAYLGRSGYDYRRGIFGRYFNLWNLWTNPPHFERWSVSPGGGTPPYDVNEQGVRKAAASSPTQYFTTYIRDQAEQFLQENESNDSQPWFLEITPYAPHSPYEIDTPYTAANYPQSNFPPYTLNPSQQETDLSDKPPYVQDWGDRENIFGTSPEGARLKQLRTLKSVDDMVDHVMQKLQQLGEENDTLAFFTSDNGYQWDEHGLSRKSKPYIDSTRVPLYMRWPENPRVRRGVVDNGLAANIDVAPTVLDAVGESTDPGFPMDGQSLLDGSPPRNRILSEYWGDLNQGAGLPKWNVPPWASLRTANYHYVEYYDEEGTQPTFQEFYDLQNDPWELNNLYGGDGDPSNNPPTSPTAAQLSAQIAKDRNCDGSECSPGPGAPTAADDRDPYVSLDEPTDNVNVNQNLNVKATSFDDFGVAGVQFKVDSTNIGAEDQAMPYQVQLDTTTLSEGAHTLTAIARYTAGNTATSSVDVTVDNVQGLDVQSGNGGTAAKPDAGDTFTYSFGTAMNPGSFISGWLGTPAQSVKARIIPDDPNYGFNDSLRVLRPDDTQITAIGEIDLGYDKYVGLFNPITFSSSTLAMSPDGKTLTLTLGGTPATFVSGVATSMRWHTSSQAQKVGGQPLCQCTVWEGIPPSGSEDIEF